MKELAQLGIAVFGVAAIYLSQHPVERVRRWGCIAGLCGQPFWIASSYLAGQWGILALTALYTMAWCRGVRTYWLRGGRA